MDTAPVIVAMITVFIFANGFFVAAEYSTAHARPARISQQATAGNQFAKLLEPIIMNGTTLDQCIASCQLGITVCNIILGFYGQWSIARNLFPMLIDTFHIHEVTAQIIASGMVLLVLTVLQVVIGQILPQSVAIHYPEEVALFVVIPLRWSMTFFQPAITILHNTSQLFLRLLATPLATHRGHILSPEEIEQLATESAREGLIEEDEQQLLHNVFRAGELTAAKVMVPRTRMICAKVDTPLRTLLEMATSSAHTRIPLYRESIDTIVGSVHVKDLFRLHIEQNVNVATVLRKVSYVPENKPALAVWNQLRQEKSYVAIVLDEFGGTAGMITVADLLEEIFGELQDEFDEEPALVARGPDGCARLHGEVLIADVNEWFHLKLPDEEVNTIGGLVMATLGRLPRVGDEVMLDETTLYVQAVNGPAIVEVRLYLPSQDESQQQEKKGDEQ